MKVSHIVFPIILLFSLSAGAVNDLWPEALRALQSGDYPKSLRLFRSLLNENPRNPLYWFNTGNAYFMTGDYRRAALCFQNVQKLKSPLTPAAQLYRSKALWLEGKRGAALELVKFLNENPSTPEGIRRESKTDLIEYQRELKRSSDEERPFWLFLEAAGGAGPKGPAATGTLSVGYKFWSNENWYANSGYNGNANESLEHTSLSVRSHEVRANLARESTNRLIMVSPFLIHESYGGTPARLAEGLSLRGRTDHGSLELGSEAKLTFQQKGSDEFDYLEGNTIAGSVFLGWVHAPLYVRLSLNFEKQNIGDQRFTDGSVIPMAFSGFGPELRALWKITQFWFTDASVLWSSRSYPTVAMPGREKREDKDLEASLRLNRRLSSGLFAFTSLSHRANMSTLGPSSVKNENYTETQGLVGLAWDAL